MLREKILCQSVLYGSPLCIVIGLVLPAKKYFLPDMLLDVEQTSENSLITDHD